jgi:hypothetical protein
MKVITALTLSLFLFCENQECRSGSFSISSLAKYPSKSIVSTVQTELPPDFKFSSSDMLKTIIGAWMDKNGDTVMNCFVGQESKISYNVEVEGYKCGPTCAVVHFQCTGKLPAFSFSGSIMFYNSTDSGEVQIVLANKLYRMSNHFQKSCSTYVIIPFTDVPELDFSKGDSLLLSR